MPKENDAGGLSACITIIRAWLSVVELQRQLYVPRWLSACDLPHRGSETHVRCIELDVVECIDKVGPELQSESLSELKVLMQTHVHVGEVRRTQTSELWRAVSESAHRRLGEVSVVGEPLNPHSRD